MATSESVTITAPSHWDPSRVASHLRAWMVSQGVQQVEKALKNPLRPEQRAAAGRGFARLQQTMGEQVKLFFTEPVAHTYHPQAQKLWAAMCRDFYERAFEYGLRAGGANRLEDATGAILKRNEQEVVARQVANEATYAGNFLTDVEHGEGTMPYDKRAQMYANALREVYWQGYLYADLSADRFVKWVMPAGAGWSEVEHCRDCARLSGHVDVLDERDLQIIKQSGMRIGGRWGNGVYQARELAAMGVTPQSGQLLCTTHCHCSIVPAEKPETKPHGKQEGQFVSLRPKPFTGTEKDERGRIRVMRHGNPERRARYARKAEDTEHRHIPRGTPKGAR